MALLSAAFLEQQRECSIFASVAATPQPPLPGGDTPPPPRGTSPCIFLYVATDRETCRPAAIRFLTVSADVGKKAWSAKIPPNWAKALVFRGRTPPSPATAGSRPPPASA